MKKFSNLSRLIRSQTAHMETIITKHGPIQRAAGNLIFVGRKYEVILSWLEPSYCAAARLIESIAERYHDNINFQTPEKKKDMSSKSIFTDFFSRQNVNHLVDTKKKLAAEEDRKKVCALCLLKGKI